MRWKLAVVALAASSAVGGAACFAEREECTRGTPEPVLHRSQFESKGDSGAEETFEIGSATSLTITHFGCAHYAERYTFVVTNDGHSPADLAHWSHRAAGLLKALPAVETVRPQLDAMAASLSAFDEPIPLSETESITFQVAALSATVRRVEIVYQVTL